jgi:hypothetical protein
MTAQFIEGWLRFWSIFNAPVVVVVGFFVAALVFSFLWSVLVGIVRGVRASLAK